MEKIILGTKLGMTQIFTEKGEVIAVTAVAAGPCTVMQIKNKDIDGYNAIRVGFGDIHKNRVNKPDMGLAKKAGTQPKRYIREFRINDTSAYEVGKDFNVEVFSVGDVVDVTSRTKGRGFTGVIKRWNQHRVGPMSHGTGPIHRSVGSMGANSSPSRVFKNKHMAGQYGNEQVTIQNLTVVKIDPAKNVLLIKGGIPGPEGVLVTIKKAVKK